MSFLQFSECENELFKSKSFSYSIDIFAFIRVQPPTPNHASRRVDNFLYPTKNAIVFFLF